MDGYFSSHRLNVSTLLLLLLLLVLLLLLLLRLWNAKPQPVCWLFNNLDKCSSSSFKHYIPKGGGVSLWLSFQLSDLSVQFLQFSPTCQFCYTELETRDQRLCGSFCLCFVCQCGGTPLLQVFCNNLCKTL